jgi:hypothetical protein
METVMVKHTGADTRTVEGLRAAESVSSKEDVLAGNDDRVLSAWRQWLGALATDADAAHAAAMAYKDLDGAGRDVWLDALARDTGDMDVPKIAVYAPLLAVEIDPARRGRIEQALCAPAVSGDDEGRSGVGLSGAGLGVVGAEIAPRRVQALQGVVRGSKQHVAAVIMPLYLDFVQVFACGYVPGVRFEWVRHDPIVVSRAAPEVGSSLGDATLEARPLKSLIDELAITVLAQRRAGLDLPSALEVLAELFAPCLDDEVPDSLREGA